MLTVEVRGGDRVAAALRAVRDRLRDLSSSWRQIGADLIATAIPLTPVLSGRLVASLTSRVTGDAVTVSSDLVYAGVQNRGWPARNIAAHNFLTGRTFAAVEDRAVNEIESAIEQAARRAGLPV